MRKYRDDGQLENFSVLEGIIESNENQKLDTLIYHTLKVKLWYLLHRFHQTVVLYQNLGFDINRKWDVNSRSNGAMSTVCKAAMSQSYDWLRFQTPNGSTSKPTRGKILNLCDSPEVFFRRTCHLLHFCRQPVKKVQSYATYSIVFLFYWNTTLYCYPKLPVIR